MLRVPATCTVSLLSHPTSQSLTHLVYSRLSLLSYLSPLPASIDAGMEAIPECATTLRFFQLVIGALLPLGWQAATEARLFRQHQEQRRRAGLQPERGLDARLYAAILVITEDEVARPFFWLLAFMLLGLCWDGAAMLSASPVLAAVPPAAAAVASAAA